MRLDAPGCFGMFCGIIIIPFIIRQFEGCKVCVLWCGAGESEVGANEKSLYIYIYISNNVK